MKRLRERLLVVEPTCDGGVVGGRRRERGAGQAHSRHRRDLAALPQFREHGVVVLRTADRRHVRVALRRRAQQRRAADVDHLDDVAVRRVRRLGGTLEGIEVHADEVERSDPVLRERCQVVGHVAPGEDAAVDLRVERLHAPSEQLREAGHVLDAGHGQSRPLEGFRRAAARDELEPDLGQAAGERLEAGLVVDGDQRAHSSRTTLGSNRCSAACTRSRRVSTESPASTGTGVLAMTSPVSMPPST